MNDTLITDSDPWYGPVRSYVKIFEEYEYSILIAGNYSQRLEELFRLWYFLPEILTVKKDIF